ncbi:hypothetical protein PSPO01_06145 [Paraphaeosphaeria sporulosa]
MKPSPTAFNAPLLGPVACTQVCYSQDGKGLPTYKTDVGAVETAIRVVHRTGRSQQSKMSAACAKSLQIREGVMVSYQYHACSVENASIPPVAFRVRHASSHETIYKILELYNRPSGHYIVVSSSSKCIHSSPSAIAQ